jgi:ketosteroid isomerase-like protein
MVWFTRTLTSALIVLCSASCASTSQSRQTSVAAAAEGRAAEGSPDQAARAFLDAFDRLEWDRFRSYLADDMTMFFPFAQTPSRVDGREAVERVFESFFRAERRQLADSGAPITQGLNPRDMKVQLAGADAAVVTFHLGSEKSPARRSLVLRRTGSEWKVIHWHASAIGTGGTESANSDTPVATVSESVLQSYVGEYQLSRKQLMTITLDGLTLFAQLTGQRKVPIYPESPTRFFYKAVDARITFQVDPGGRVTGMILHQNGRNQPLKKLK